MQVTQILNANLIFTRFSREYHNQIWIKLKWDHTRSTSFHIKKESSKSVHPVKGNKHKKIKKYRRIDNLLLFEVR